MCAYEGADVAITYEKSAERMAEVLSRLPFAAARLV
jgi:hypothetical protein